MPTRQCDWCGGFLREEPDQFSLETGVDEEVEFGTGHVWRTGWAVEFEHRECRSCGNIDIREAVCS